MRKCVIINFLIVIQGQMKIYIEILRIIAAYFVIFNHTSENGFFLFANYSEGTLNFWIYCFISVFCKASVPIFFMISGMLLLDKDEPYSYIITKRIPKAVCPLVFWSGAYYVRIYTMSGQQMSISDFINKLLNGTITGGLWFLYSYIGFLIILPLLRAMAGTLHSEMKWLIIFFPIMFTGVIPILRVVLGLNLFSISGYIKQEWLLNTQYILYPLLGYLCEHIIKEISTKKLVVLSIFNIICIFLCCYATYITYGVEGYVEGKSQTYFSSLVCVNAIAMFFVTKKLSMHFLNNKIIARKTCLVGKSTFGVYLIHQMILLRWRTFAKLWDIMRVDLKINDMLTALLICSIVFILSSITAMIMKRLPVLNRVV